jgi:hypothetical protein
MIESKKYIANEIVKAVSEKLGREAICRKVNNREEYFILDLAFSYFQKADRNRRNDYRSGYLYERIRGKNHLHFVLAHTPIMSAFFKNNFDYEIFRKIIKNTAKYRNENFLVLKRRNCIKAKIRTLNTNEFLQKLDDIEKDDLVRSVLSPPGEGRTGIGNIFGITLANDFSSKDIKKIISKSWFLFLWLYPSKPIFQRNASLNRSLQKIETKCEIGKIINLPDAILNKDCSGQIEGAHINPHKNGGSDRLENGVWLCNLHHRLTEGKLAGKRSLTLFEVKYKE